MTALAARPTAPTVPATVLGEARLLAGVVGPGGVARLDLAAHSATHGALPAVDREHLQRWTAEVRLLGRGGGAFPVHRKLAALPARGPFALVANGSESEPASRKDRVLMIRCPHLVLDGLALIARALATDAIVIAVHDRAAADSLQRALAERADLPTARIVRGEAAFVAGESHALLNGVAGSPAVPSGRAVHATTHGLSGAPTFLANVETFAQLAVLARIGPAAFARTGSAHEPGTRLFTVGGAVPRPGVVEAPAGVPLDFLLGAPDRVAGVLLGGYHGVWTSLAPLALSVPAVADAGLSLGAGVAYVLDDTTCPLGEVGRVARWLAGQSAGQCGPCVFGLPALAADLEAIVRADRAGVERAERHLAVLPGRGACAHPDGTARFVRSALAHFQADLAAHARGGCGRPVVGQLPLPTGESR
jgi:NADH:ubiquinone oxidoreductase subunit F (NADH-binding)